MIITLNQQLENTQYAKISKIIDKCLKKLDVNTQIKRGRPLKYNDKQIISCLIYGIKNNIFSLRELEYKINQDIVFMTIIGIEKSPDYSTFSIRLGKIENLLYEAIYMILVYEINANFRLCSIDSTALRSSKFDKDAKVGRGTRLGMYKGYKLHLACTTDDLVIPLCFSMTTANVYDNQAKELLYETKKYNPFLILADAAYDDTEWFEICKKLEVNLLTDINMRRAKSIKSFNGHRYENAVFRKSVIGDTIYKKNRIKIEQLFSSLKGMYNLENPRLYGFKRYFRHVSWVLMCYLIDELIKKNEGINSRKYPWNI